VLAAMLVLVLAIASCSPVGQASAAESAAPDQDMPDQDPPQDPPSDPYSGKTKVRIQSGVGLPACGSNPDDPLTECDVKNEGYAIVLGRLYSDADGGAAASLAAAYSSLAEVKRVLASSPEAASRIAYLYSVCLLRPDASAGEIAAWQDQLSGGSMWGVANQIASSEEARTAGNPCVIVDAVTGI
jgi:hypothetical protein